MNIRRATEYDIAGINRLLEQVLMVHHVGRPDLFRSGAKKYTDDELRVIIADDQRPIFTAVDEEGNVLGYAFCVFQQHIGSNIMTDIKTLYIDDLCVDAEFRRRGIGAKLYRYVLDVAKENGCDSVTLNVWSLNDSALRFYRSMGMEPLKTMMEAKLNG